MKRRSILALALAVLCVFALFCGCSGGGGKSGYKIDKNKDKIVFGGARSQSGVYAFFDQAAFGPIYRMWAEEVNADGGIYVKEYGKKLPVELKVYDDTSDLATMTRLYEKLILEDKVDFLLAPVSTAFLYAVAPIANKNGYILMGAEGGSTTLKESIAQYPYFFSTLNFSDTQVPALVDILTANKVKSAYIVFIEDLHGTEYSGAAVPAFAKAGIDVKGVKSVPADIQDMTAIINDAQASGAQAFLVFAYPDQGFLAIGQAMAMNYNPDVFLIGPGGSFDSIKAVFGEDAIEGLMSWGAWNGKSSEAAKDFLERFQARYADDPNVCVDWWGHLPYYAGLQIMQQAIEACGTLDQSVLRDYIATNKFNTVLGETYFENNLLAADCYLGNVGQWQKGQFEVIDIGEKNTAPAIVPKPEWPKS